MVVLASWLGMLWAPGQASWTRGGTGACRVPGKDHVMRAAGTNRHRLGAAAPLPRWTITGPWRGHQPGQPSPTMECRAGHGGRISALMSLKCEIFPHGGRNLDSARAEPWNLPCSGSCSRSGVAKAKKLPGSGSLSHSDISDGDFLSMGGSMSLWCAANALLLPPR